LKVTLNVNRTLSVNGDEEAQKEKVCSQPPLPLLRSFSTRYTNRRHSLYFEDGVYREGWERCLGLLEVKSLDTCTKHPHVETWPWGTRKGKTDIERESGVKGLSFSATLITQYSSALTHKNFRLFGRVWLVVYFIAAVPSPSAPFFVWQLLEQNLKSTFFSSFRLCAMYFFSKDDNSQSTSFLPKII
jgi:hypothetical protein